jgi:hypothetical protein
MSFSAENFFSTKPNYPNISYILCHIFYVMPNWTCVIPFCVPTDFLVNKEKTRPNNLRQRRMPPLFRRVGRRAAGNWLNWHSPNKIQLIERIKVFPLPSSVFLWHCFLGNWLTNHQPTNLRQQSEFTTASEQGQPTVSQPLWSSNRLNSSPFLSSACSLNRRSKNIVQNRKLKA